MLMDVTESLTRYIYIYIERERERVKKVCVRV